MEFVKDSRNRNMDGPKSGTGFVPIPLTSLREIVSNEMGDRLYKNLLRREDIPLTALREVTTNNIPNAAGNGGLLASDTTPIFEFTNGDTDSALRLRWASSNSDAVTFQFTLPDDFDDTQNIVVKTLAAMGGTTDTPTITVESFFDVGDTKVADATGSVTGTTAATYSATVAAADFPASRTLSIELTPGAHTTDTLLIYAVWVEYYITSSPRIEYVNGDTDSQIRVTWVASNVDKVAFNTPIPPDIDPSQPVYLKMYVDSGGSTDTPTFTVESFWNVGDTKVSDTSEATAATPAVKTTTIAAADLPTYPVVAAFELTPGAHTTDDLYLYALWLEYQKL